MYAGIILHNIIVENEGHSVTNWDGDDGDTPIHIVHGYDVNFQCNAL